MLRKHKPADEFIRWDSIGLDGYESIGPNEMFVCNRKQMLSYPLW